MLDNKYERIAGSAPRGLTPPARTLPARTLPAKTLLAAVLVAALLGLGCSGGTLPQAGAPPVTVPDAWNGAETDTQPTEAELASWWSQLGDPVLDALVERTLAGNVDLETAVARVAEARARRGLAKSDLGPSITANPTAARTDPLGDTGRSNDSFSAGLDVAWEADLFGSKQLSLAASRADLGAEIDNLRAAHVSLVAETAVAYTDLRVAEARLQVIDETLESREETSRLTDWREQAGLASRLEVSQAESNLELARAGRPATERIATDARLRLSLLAGLPPGSLDPLLSSSGGLSSGGGLSSSSSGTSKSSAPIPTPPETLAVGIPADTLRQRPDVRAAEWRIEAAAARLGVAERGRYPTLRFSGSIEARSSDLDDLLDIDSLVADLFAGLTAPIFESGRIEQNILIQTAQWDQAVLAYRGTVLQALSEVEQALAAFHTSEERIAFLGEATRAAQEAADLAEQRYAAGLVDLLSVLETQRTVFTTREQLAIAQGELANAFSNLYRALGGGWQSQVAPDEGETHA
ncbi:MAG: TolC family protein [Acidobacteriota bacterium]